MTFNDTLNVGQGQVPWGCNGQTCAVKKRTPNLEGGRIKRQWRELQKDVFWTYRDVVCTSNQAHNRSVLHQNALRHSSRPRRVENIGEIALANRFVGCQRTNDGQRMHVDELDIR